MAAYRAAFWQLTSTNGKCIQVFAMELQDKCRVCALQIRHVTGSFLAYRFVTPVRIMLTGTRSGRIFHVRFGTGPVAGLFGTGPLPDQPVIPVESTG